MNAPRPVMVAFRAGPAQVLFCIACNMPWWIAGLRPRRALRLLDTMAACHIRAAHGGVQ